MLDILFKNAQVIDGTGKKAFQANIGIKEGEIALISKEDTKEEAKEVIELKGLALSPGFIDIHSHSDTTFLWYGRADSKISQGVTSELAGQCGSTIHPALEERMDDMREYAFSDGLFDSDFYASSSYEGFMEKSKDLPQGTHLLTLVGHGGLRAGVMGEDAKKASEEDIKNMQKLLEEDLKNGAWGLSLGLGYSPGVNATMDELVALGHIVKKYDGIITSHIRDQQDNILDSLDEMFEINRQTGAKVHIAHIKNSGKKNWGRSKETYEYIKKAQKEGVDVSIDGYPYRAASSGITNSFPKWSLEGGHEEIIRRLKGSDKEKIKIFLEEHFQTKEDGEGLYIVDTGNRYPVADGKTIYELSQELDLSMADTIIKVTLETDTKAICISFSMADSDVYHYLSQPDILIGSDGSAFPLDPKENRGKPHPRNFGTFPRFLRLARENNWQTLEERIKRITKDPADRIGIKDRGIIKEGYMADIVVFNPEIIKDKATFENPFQQGVGIEHVLLDGKFSLKNGELTNESNGGFFLKK